MKPKKTSRKRKMTIDRKNATANSLVAQTVVTQVENTYSMLTNVKDLLMRLVSPNMSTTIGDLCETICSVQEHLTRMHMEIVLMREGYAKMSKEEMNDE